MSAGSKQSQAFTMAFKRHGSIGTELAIPFMARRLAEEIPRHEVLRALFVDPERTILVPAPRRAPLVQGGLWPSMEICRSMEQRQVAGRVLPLLARTIAVAKSAVAAQGQRPSPETHYDSIQADPKRPLLSARDRLIVVDDVVTRGATFLACAARLAEAYPNVEIHCFGAIRTMSGVEVDGMLAPVAGFIRFDGVHLHRHP